MISKIKTLDELREIVIKHKTNVSVYPWEDYVPGPVVTANGVFDILHPGHVFFLEEAKSAGTLLVVGVNSDRSVRENKGPQRPINDELYRAKVIAGLGCVDYVAIFDELEPLEFLRAIKPNIHYLGEKYALPENRIHEMDVVENELGGRCMFTTYTDNSSTNVIEKILRVYGKNG